MRKVPPGIKTISGMVSRSKARSKKYRPMRVVLAMLGDTTHHTTRRSDITPSITIARTSGSAMLTNIKIYKLAFQKLLIKVLLLLVDGADDLTLARSRKSRH